MADDAFWSIIRTSTFDDRTNTFCSARRIGKLEQQEQSDDPTATVDVATFAHDWIFCFIEADAADLHASILAALEQILNGLGSFTFQHQIGI